MKNLYYIIFFLIIGCTPETIIETEYITKPVTEPTIEELRNVYYNGEFDGADYYKYFEIFMWEAENYGVDLNYVKEHLVIIEPRTNQNPNLVAWAKERDNDEKVHIGVNTNLFFNKTRSNRGRLLVMFHEFGHDILNLTHTSVNSCSNITHIMDPCGKQDIDKDKLKQLVKDLFNH